VSRYSNVKQSKTTNEALNKKLFHTLLAIIGIITFLIVGIVFFAPQVGSFFGLFSANRNQPDDIAVVKPDQPVFSNIPKATKNNSITINGYTQSGYSVKLFVNGPEVANVVAGADGIFTFYDIKLIDGQNTIFAKTVDNTNVESDSTNVFNIYVDKDKPKIDITSPKDGDRIKNLDKRISITGKVSEKAQVKINDKIAIVKPDLTFDFLLGVQNEGNVKISIVATDEAGNENIRDITVNYERESF
jgi:hypothetical protein